MILILSIPQILTPSERTFGFDAKPCISFVHVNYYLLPVHGGRIRCPFGDFLLDVRGLYSDTYKGILLRGEWKIKEFIPSLSIFYEETDKARFYPDFGIEACGEYWRIGTKGILLHPREIFCSLYWGKQTKIGYRISYREGWGLEGRGGIGFYTGSIFFGMGASINPFTASVLISFPTKAWNITISITEHPDLGEMITTSINRREHEGDMP